MMEERNNGAQDNARLRNVRRRLFDDDDDDDDEREPGLYSGVEDNLVNRVFEEARKSRETAKQRWNFDFEKEEPLPGRYEWVKLDQDGNEITNPVEANSAIGNSDEGAKGNVQSEFTENSESRNDEGCDST